MATSQPPPRNTPSLWTDLPPELFAAMFEGLREDALRSCALVHRQWRWPAQRRLFRQVYVNTHTHFLGLTEALRASPHLRPFVKILMLNTASAGAEAADRADGLLPAVEELCATGRDLAIAAHLPQLKTLRVVDIVAAKDQPAPSARLPIALECIHFSYRRGLLLPEWFTRWVALTETHAAQSLKELKIVSSATVSSPDYMRAFLLAHAHLDLLELWITNMSDDQTRPDISLGVVATSHLVLVVNKRHLSSVLLEIAGILRATVFSRRLEHLFVRFSVAHFREGCWISQNHRVPDMIPPGLAPQLASVTIIAPGSTHEQRAVLKTLFRVAERPHVLEIRDA